MSGIDETPLVVVAGAIVVVAGAIVVVAGAIVVVVLTSSEEPPQAEAIKKKQRNKETFFTNQYAFSK